MIGIKQKLIRMVNKVLCYGLKRGYTIHKFDNGQYAVVRIINVFPTKNEANNCMIDLVTNHISEYEVLKEYSKK